MWREIFTLQRMAWILLGVFLSFAGRSAAQFGGDVDRSFLTTEERLWLEGNRSEFCVAPEANYPPLSFADAGIWRGLSVDMLRLVEAKLGVRFVVLAPQNLDAILTRAQKGEAGIITSVRETPVRSQYLSFTPPYVSIPTVIIVKADSNLGHWPEAFAGKKVAVGRGYGVQSFLEQKLPSLSLVLTPDDLDGLRRLSFGEIDAVITDVASASYFIEKEKITNLRVLSSFDYEYDLSLAVRKDLPILRQILAKTLRAVSERDRQAVLKHWIQIETDPVALLREKYQRFLAPGLAVLVALLAAGATAWIIALRQRIAPRNLAVALSLLAAGMILTGGVAFYTKVDAESDARRKFDFVSDEIRLNIVARLRACAQVLHSGAGLFAASESVERAKWRAFTQSLQLSQQLPGIQGVGFAQYLRKAQLAEHEQAIRREGFPEYQVKPVGDRETYSAIIYLEPFADRNLRAFGFDMLSEDVRRTAMERARDEHAAALSGKVILVQETGEEVQAGTLMYVPVYHQGKPLETVEQRRAALQGWVYSPYRMGDLIRGTLREGKGTPKDHLIDLQVYDGEVLSAENLLYDTRSAGDKGWSAPQVSRLVPVDFAGRRWTLRFSQLGGLVATADYTSVWFALSGGTIVSLLNFFLALSLLNTRANAQRIAAQLTQELRQSEKRFAIMADAAPVLIWESGPDRLCSYFNKTWLDFTGRTLAQEIGNGWAEGAHPDDLARCCEIFVSRFDARREFEREFRLRRHDGQYRWLLDHGVPRFHADGTFAGYIGSCIDITERKQAAAALQKSEERYALAERAVDEALWERNLVADEVYCSSRWKDILGYEGGESPKRMAELVDLIHPDDRSRTKEAIRRHLEDRTPYAVEYRLRHKDGRYRWMLSRGEAVRDATGKPLRMLGSITDITERKQIEAELVNNQQRLALALEQAQLAYWEMDAATVTFIFNDRFYALYGTTAEREGGYRMTPEVYAREFLPPEEQHIVAPDVARLLSGEVDEIKADHCIRRRDGELRHVHVRITTIRDQAGRIVGTRGVNQDITERTAQQLKLKELLAQTERDARTKGELLREVNHRVTNNLTAVLGLLVYERESFADDGRALVAPALDRLQQRIRGLLTVHRMLSQSAWAPVNLAHLAEEIIRAALSAAPWRNQAVVTIEPSDLRVSPRQAGGLALVFNELTTNTVKYARPDSRTVKIGVWFGSDDAKTTICYRDNGPGYTTDVLENQRTNIGLKLIRDVVTTTLGGTVELENNDGARTTIRMQPELETRT